MADENTNETPTNEQPNTQEGAPQEGNQAPAPEAGGNDDGNSLPDWAQKKLREANAEAAKYRVKAKEYAEKAAKAETLEEKVKALEAEKAELAKAAEVAKRLERRLELTTVLGDAKLAELVEPHAEKYTGEDGKFDADKFFADFPNLKQAQSSPVRGANPGRPRGELTLDELDKMSPEAINEWFAKRKKE